MPSHARNSFAHRRAVRGRGDGHADRHVIPRRSHPIVAAPLILVALLAGCRDEAPAKVKPAVTVRPVRVLLHDARDAVRVRIDGPYALRNATGAIVSTGDRLPWTAVARGSRVRFGAIEPDTDRLVLEDSDGRGIRFVAEKGDGNAVERRYPGAVIFSAPEDNRLRAVNTVDIEAYVASVVAYEAWPGFHDAALQAQAVASRTYALYLMSRRADRPFDLRAGEGDQVYRGMRLDDFGRRAARATESTNGIVLSTASPDGLRIICAYYSAVCGGRSQSLADVRGGSAPEPLRGGVACDYCRIAKGNTYRWGPVSVAKVDLLARLKQRDRRFGDWRGITRVAVSQTTEYNRIREVTVTSKSSKTLRLRAEPFRLAVGSRAMLSTDCTMVDAGATLRFENGKGFGHGMGMCQWGAEGQAREGRRAGEILRYYYPGVRIVRAY